MTRGTARRPSGAEAGSPRLVAMGELLVDFVGEPAGLGLAATEHFVRRPGGAPANVAVGARRLGVASAFVGMVGADAFGAWLRDVLVAEGVDVRGLRTTADQPTTLAFVARDAAAVPSFVFVRHPGADQCLAPADVEASVFARAEVFHFGSLSLGRSPAREATERALGIARDRGLFVTYDPNWRPALWADPAAGCATLRSPLGVVDLLKVSREELKLLSGREELESGCDALRALGPRHVVVTLGAEGMFVAASDGCASVAGEQIVAVDTTGCGDTAVAALLAALLRRPGGLGRGVVLGVEELLAAARFANACAAITARGVGAIPAMPRLADVSHLLP